MTILGYALIAGLVLAMIWTGKASNMLRDQINDPTAFLGVARRRRRYGIFLSRKRRDIPRPFSLARTQLAFWTTVIGGAYLYVYFSGPHAGKTVVIDGTTLALLGISAGTTAGGMIIDTSQQGDYRHQNQPSDSFFIDILSDASGVSIARFQQVVWSVIAAISYVTQIPGLSEGHLPTMNYALLGLAGLSSVTYLTMKAGENAGNSAGIAVANSIISAASSSPPVGTRPTTVPTFNRGVQSQP